MVGRTFHHPVPPRTEYRLTPTGREPHHTINGFRRWSRRHPDDILASRHRFDRARHQRSPPVEAGVRLTMPRGRPRPGAGEEFGARGERRRGVPEPWCPPGGRGRGRTHTDHGPAGYRPDGRETTDGLRVRLRSR
ncbi:hypothetical protein GCM10027160_41000 [Streptomyces calidiresistens]